MDVFAGFHGRVLAAVQQLKHDGVVPHDASVDGITLEPPKDFSHGDLATNAAMVLAKAAGQPPRALAERIVPLFASDPHIDSVEIAGPGFINLTLSSAFWPSVLRMVLEQGAAYGSSAIGKGEAVNVEYVSANPTGPMHVGHCRGAVFGDALANLLAFAGYAVTREYYVNDAGAQVDALARSAYPALPRGARRGHRRNSRRTLSRRLSEAGRRRSSPISTARSCLRCTRRNGFPSCAPPRYRRCWL